MSDTASELTVNHIQDLDWIVNRAKQQLNSAQVDPATLLDIIYKASVRRFEVLSENLDGITTNK